MGTTKEQVADRVFGILEELASIPRGDIRGGDRLREDLGLDSMQNMELLSRVSEEFNIDPDMDTVMKVVTVDEVVTLLAGHVGAPAQ